MTDDRIAIAARAQRLLRWSALEDPIQNEISEINIALLDATLFIEGDYKLPLKSITSRRVRIRKIRMLRAILKRIGRIWLIELAKALEPVSNSYYRIELRHRKDSERPADELPERLRAMARLNPSERRDAELAAYIYELMDQGADQESAIKKALEDLKINLSPTTVKQNLKALRKNARVRGYVDPYALVYAWMSGTTDPNLLPKPSLTVERMMRKGRPAKKE